MMFLLIFIFTVCNALPGKLLDEAPSSFKCDFEKGFCGFRHDEDADFEWEIEQGFSGLLGTGPSADHTIGYATTADTLPNGPGSLVHVSGKCIFISHTPGYKPEDGALVTMRSGCGKINDELVLTEEGHLNFTKWNMCVRRQGGHHLYRNYLVISDHDCTQFTYDRGLVREVRTGRCIIPYGGNHNYNDQYVFLDKKCEDLFQFGPTLGSYAAMNEWFKKENETARLISPPIIQGKCFHFWYTMNGKAVNKLNVYLKGSTTPLWSKHGNHGNVWREAQISINSNGEPYQLVFEAIFGNNRRCHIAIDDVSVTEECAGPLECDLEETNPVLCGYTNPRDDAIDWNVGQGEVEVNGTGPTADHTYNDGYGKYIYVKANGEQSSIESPWYQPREEGHCFQFWYHMNEGDNKLSILSESLAGARELTSISSNGENKWLATQVEIEGSSEPFKIRFATKGGTSYGGYVALDDFKMLTGPCNWPAYCTFESDRCMWKNTVTEDDFDWRLGNGKRFNSYEDQSPLIDHTTRTPYGNFMCMETTMGPEALNKTARLESEVIRHTIDSPSTFCLLFAFHMDIDVLGALHVYVKTGSGSSEEKLVWTLKGDQGRGWKKGQARIDSRKDFRLVFEGHHDGVEANTIALDDIEFAWFGCNVIPAEAKPKM